MLSEIQLVGLFLEDVSYAGQVPNRQSFSNCAGLPLHVYRKVRLLSWKFSWNLRKIILVYMMFMRHT